MVLCSPTQHKGHVGEGWLSGSIWLSYVRRKGDLLARSCASILWVFLGSSFSVLSYFWRRSIKDAAVWDVIEMKCSRSMCGLTWIDRIINEEIKRSVNYLLRWFGHVEKWIMKEWH